MTLFNLIIVLAAFCHPKADGIVKPVTAPSVDSLQMMEKVYIHTDRTSYYPADELWFKAYLIHSKDRSLSGKSNNLHVELISPDSKIIVSRIIRLDGGLGNGDFILPDELQPGKYRLRAYTNYMRNFGEQLFFNKDIDVINPTDAIEKIPNEKKVVKNQLDISFFPEGGSLVDNISSLVAFKAVNGLGKGCDVSGKIYTSAGDLITSFKSVHLGMGSFNFRPIPGLSYYSIVKDSTGLEVRSAIPKSLPGGVTLSVSNQNDELLITTKTNSQTLPLVQDRDLTLSFSARKVPIKSFNFKMKSYNNTFALPVDSLPDGVIMMTLSAPGDLPLSERLIFIQKENDFEVSIEPRKQVYKQRDSVEIRLSFANSSDNRPEAFLSLSAAEKSFTDNHSQYPSTISSWFLLESDVHGPIEEPSYYFDPSNPKALQDLDLLLLTQGWRDFKWKYSKGYFPHESGFSISGRLRKNDDDRKLEADKVSIAIVDDKNSITTTAPIDAVGKFRLDGIDFTGEASLIISAVGKKGYPEGLVVLDTLTYSPEEVVGNLSPELVLSKEVVTAFKQANAEKAYKLSDTISLGEINVVAAKRRSFLTTRIENGRSAYDKPDNEVIVTSKYAGYSNVFEILKGRVAGVIVVEGFKGYDIKIRGQHSIDLTSTPLFLIDGIQKSYEAMVAFPVGYIDRIDILKSAGEIASYGVRGANGVIAIITRTGDNLQPIPPDKHSANINFTGYDAARIFYTPKHSPSSASDKEPDLRTTLFWDPNITLQSNQTQFLNYFNADHSSTIRIIVEGITSNGIPLTASAEYEVR